MPRNKTRAGQLLRAASSSSGSQAERLGPLLQGLDERDRAIIEMRFGQEMTQAGIGRELNVSQMHVSRLLSRILTRLRTGLLST